MLKAAQNRRHRLKRGCPHRDTAPLSHHVAARARRPEQTQRDGGVLAGAAGEGGQPVCGVHGDVRRQPDRSGLWRSPEAAVRALRAADPACGRLPVGEHAHARTLYPLACWENPRGAAGRPLCASSLPAEASRTASLLRSGCRSSPPNSRCAQRGPVPAQPGSVAHPCMVCCCYSGSDCRNFAETSASCLFAGAQHTSWLVARSKFRSEKNPANRPHAASRQAVESCCLGRREGRRRRHLARRSARLLALQRSSDGERSRSREFRIRPARFARASVRVRVTESLITIILGKQSRATGFSRAHYRGNPPGPLNRCRSPSCCLQFSPQLAQALAR